MEKQYKTYDDLPLMLSVQDVSAVLGISRAGAYELVKSEGFPTMNIGSRIIVPKEDFILWCTRPIASGHLIRCRIWAESLQCNVS